MTPASSPGRHSPPPSPPPPTRPPPPSPAPAAHLPPPLSTPSSPPSLPLLPAPPILPCPVASLPCPSAPVPTPAVGLVSPAGASLSAPTSPLCLPPPPATGANPNPRSGRAGPAAVPPRVAPPTSSAWVPPGCWVVGARVAGFSSVPPPPPLLLLRPGPVGSLRPGPPQPRSRAGRREGLLAWVRPLDSAVPGTCGRGSGGWCGGMSSWARRRRRSTSRRAFPVGGVAAAADARALLRNWRHPSRRRHLASPIVDPRRPCSGPSFEAGRAAVVLASVSSSDGDPGSSSPLRAI